jgi:hypothetical protein
MIWVVITFALMLVLDSLTGNIGIAFLGAIAPITVWAGIGYLIARHQERSTPGAKKERAERHAAFIEKHREQNRQRRNAT